MQDLYAILKTPGQDDVDLHELDFILKEVQKGPGREQAKEERTLEALVRALNGDEQYLSQEYQQLSRRSAATMEEFAEYLSK